MRTRHGMQWLDYVQESLQWVCPVCRDMSTSEFASKQLAEKDLKQHMLDMHSTQENERYKCAIQVSIVTYYRPQHTCFICRACYPEEETDTPLQGNSSAATASKKSLDTEARRRAENCLAGHLRYLAFSFAINLIDEDGGYLLDSQPRKKSIGTSTPAIWMVPRDKPPSYQPNDDSPHSVYPNNCSANVFLSNKPLQSHKKRHSVSNAARKGMKRIFGLPSQSGREPKNVEVADSKWKS